MFLAISALELFTAKRQGKTGGEQVGAEVFEKKFSPDDSPRRKCR
jgi:hypothetical protein